MEAFGLWRVYFPPVLTQFCLFLKKGSFHLLQNRNRFAESSFAESKSNLLEESFCETITVSLVPFCPTQHRQVRKKCGAFSARPRSHRFAGACRGVTQNPPPAWTPIACNEADKWNPKKNCKRSLGRGVCLLKGIAEGTYNSKHAEAATVRHRGIETQ